MIESHRLAGGMVYFARFVQLPDGSRIERPARTSITPVWRPLSRGPFASREASTDEGQGLSREVGQADGVPDRYRSMSAQGATRDDRQMRTIRSVRVFLFVGVPGTSVTARGLA